MKKALLGIAVGIGTTSCLFAQDLTKAPVHGKPVWQVVAGLPDAPGAPVAVRSLSTNQVLGAFPVDTRFLSFGSNGQLITTAINGELVYLPATAVTRLYPNPPRPETAPPGRMTLEDLAEEYQGRVTGAVGVNLNPSNSIVDQARSQQPAEGFVGQGANPGMPGQNFGAAQGAQQYQGQPGAALMQGGIPALGGMAGAPDRK